MDFKKIAQEKTSLSEIMTDRLLISQDEIIELYPNGATILDFDVCTLEGKEVPIVVFEELPERFMFGGAVLASIITSWIEQGESAEAVRSEYANSDRVKVKFEKTKTKSNRTVTRVTIL